jgi:hypothetical protein
MFFVYYYLLVTEGGFVKKRLSKVPSIFLLLPPISDSFK